MTEPLKLNGILEADMYGFSGFEDWRQPRPLYASTTETFDDAVKRVRLETGLIVCTCCGVQVADDKRVLLYAPTCEIHGRHRRMGDGWPVDPAMRRATRSDAVFGWAK